MCAYHQLELAPVLAVSVNMVGNISTPPLSQMRKRSSEKLSDLFMVTKQERDGLGWSPGCPGSHGKATSQSRCQTRCSCRRM